MNELEQPTKPKRRSHKPAMLQQAVIAKTMLGDTKSQIAKDLGMHRNTVSSILSAAEIQQHVSELRSDMVSNGDLIKSVRVMRQRLDKGSESAATTILRGFNVLQSGNQTTVNLQNNGVMAWQAVIEQSREQEQLEKPAETTTNSDPTPSKT